MCKMKKKHLQIGIIGQTKYVIYELYFSWLDTETGIGGVVLNVGKHGTYRVQLCLVLEK